MENLKPKFICENFLKTQIYLRKFKVKLTSIYRRVLEIFGRNFGVFQATFVGVSTKAFGAKVVADAGEILEINCFFFLTSIYRRVLQNTRR